MNLIYFKSGFQFIKYDFKLYIFSIPASKSRPSKRTCAGSSAVRGGSADQPGSDCGANAYSNPDRSEPDETPSEW